MKFIFNSYSFNKSTNEAIFDYSFSDGRSFSEKVSFAPNPDDPQNQKLNDTLLNRSLFFSFILAGTSYYKAFPTTEVALSEDIDGWQAEFFNTVYQEGLGQFAFENKLTRSDLAHFNATANELPTATSYKGSGILTLQSGGKDSLLLSTLLDESETPYSPWFLSSGDHHPVVLDELSYPLLLAKRTIDRETLTKAAHEGGLNGHVPITYIVQSYALIQAIILGKSQILVSIGHEGVEPHAFIDDLAVNHQWSKTWEAEKLFSDYVHRYISPDISVGSPLRSLSELKIAELFAKKSWSKYGHRFSSCNVANYRQHADNSELKWCGNCPKCANAYLLFSPFVNHVELQSIFDGQDLFAKPSLVNSFKGLLGIDGFMKPFECVGEIDELRKAYHMSRSNGYSSLPFAVPDSNYGYNHQYDLNPKLKNLIKFSEED